MRASDFQGLLLLTPPSEPNRNGPDSNLQAPWGYFQAPWRYFRSRFSTLDFPRRGMHGTGHLAGSDARRIRHIAQFSRGKSRSKIATSPRTFEALRGRSGQSIPEQDRPTPKREHEREKPCNLRGYGPFPGQLQGSIAAGAGRGGRTRTCDPLLRRQMLYPSELRPE